MTGARLGLFALLFASAARAQVPPDTATPAFPAGAEAVTVDVIVLDKDGAPVTDLTRDDFTVLEDGVAQTVTAFESIALPPAEERAAPLRVQVDRPAVSSNARPKPM